MAEFFNAALPFVAMGLTIALLAANGRRGRKNYLTDVYKRQGPSHLMECA